MKARIPIIFTLLATSAALSAAAAADPQLLNMVMPDAKVMAGVNVEQAKTSPFGQYVLQQIQPNDQHLQDLLTLTGFDPRRDVNELLVASPGDNNPKTGLALARGSFDLNKITAAARAGGGTVETYSRATLVTDPKKEHSLGFVDNTLVAAGTVDTVKAALDRRTQTTAAIDAVLATKVNQLSNSQDAWLVTLVPPSSLHPPHPNHPPAGATPQPNPVLANGAVLQTIQQLTGGIKFGTNVVINAEALTPTQQDATSLAGVLQFLANMALTQSNGNADVAALVQSLKVMTTGTSVQASLSLPSEQFEGLVQPKPHARFRQRNRK